jgi:hypothetical protein
MLYCPPAGLFMSADGQRITLVAMKHYLLAALLACSVPALAQTAPLTAADTVTTTTRYSAIVTVPGATQAELFGRALVWLATQPINPNDPIVKDAASGIITARVGVPFINGAGLTQMPCTIWRQVNIQTKEGQAKYELTGFQFQLYAPTPGRPVQPSKAQIKLVPFEEYLNKADGRYYAKEGRPRAYTAGFLVAASQQTSLQIKSITTALQTKP